MLGLTICGEKPVVWGGGEGYHGILRIKAIAVGGGFERGGRWGPGPVTVETE